MKNTLVLTHTAAALKCFEASEAERDDMLNHAMTNADVAAWEAAEKAATDLVRLAFFEDTKDRNCRDNCMLLHIKDLRQMVAKFGPPPAASNAASRS